MRSRLSSSGAAGQEPEVFLAVKLDGGINPAYWARTVRGHLEIWLRRVALSGVVVSLALVAAHAWHDRLNSFPDEQLHVMTTSYYLDNWLPPPISDALAPYAGVHGVSYHMLWPPQATYWLYGKAASLVSVQDPWRFYRGLSVLMWLGVLAYILRAARKQPWLFWLVGLTPAVWYVFAYYSPDALSYAVSAVLVAQLVQSDSVSRRYLLDGKPLSGALVLGVGLGLLVLSKLNYLTFSAALAVYCGVLLWRNRYVASYVRRSLLVVAIGCVIAAPLLIADMVNNAHERDQRFEATRERLAGPGFHDSDIANGTAYYGYRLRDRGVAAPALFRRPWRWGLLTSRSFFGVYGTMDVDPLPRLNDLQFILGLGLLALMVACRKRQLPADGLLFVSAALCFCVVAIVAAFLRAWTFDFQAQGRYCFAMIPILVLLAADVCDTRHAPIFWGLGAATAWAGVLSFASALPYLG